MNPRLALLLRPSANRVYTGQAADLALVELGALTAWRLDDRLTDLASEPIAGVPYVMFDVPPAGLLDDDLAELANLSAAFALFDRTDDGLLRPVELHPRDRYADDLITTQRYVGKTNEQFTKLLLNLTAWAAARRAEPLTVLDPLAGRGTTLNQALRYGWHSIGIERDQKDVEAYATFLETWMKRSRLKHTFDYGPLRRDKKVIAHRLQATVAPSKADHAAGRSQHLTVFRTDTLDAQKLIQPASVDLIVTDAPYGVQHGSRTAGGLARGPLELLAQALPGWLTTLRRGGAFGMAFNTLTARRSEVVELLAANGLQVLDLGRDATHRVDQAVMRDLVIARLP